MEFNTIAVSDGVSMGTSGMRASLVSREVIADSIELVARGHLFDGLVCLVACDKTIPAAVMALGRLDIPGLVLYTGSIAPGRWRGRDVTIQDVYEAIGAHAAGKISAAELHELESVACPAAGACGGQFTANTMSTMLEFLGISPAGRERHPGARHRRRRRPPRRRAGSPSISSAATCGPSQIITKASLENAAASVAATGGSTNGVLHLSRSRRSSAIDFTIDDFDAISARTPIVADLKPSGRYVATDVHKAGGVALVARELEEGRADPRGRAERRRADARRDRDAPSRPRGRTWSSRSRRRSSRAAALAILRGNLAPEGCVVKLAGQDRSHHRGPARVFDSEEEMLRRRQGGRDRRRRRRRDPLRGPARRARDARDAPRHRRDRRGGALARGRARSPTGASPGATHGFMVGHVARRRRRAGRSPRSARATSIVIDVERRAARRRAVRRRDSRAAAELRRQPRRRARRAREVRGARLAPPPRAR